MYTGIPVCVFSSDRSILLEAAEWFSSTYGLIERRTPPVAGTNNFVISCHEVWDNGKSIFFGSDRNAEDAEEWILDSTSFLDDSKEYIFINLDEELGYE